MALETVKMMRCLAGVFVLLVVAFPAAAQSQSPWHFEWDLLLRYDDAKDIPFSGAPGGTAPFDFERSRLQLRPRVEFSPSSSVTIQSGFAVHADSKKNEDYRLGDGTSRGGDLLVVPLDHLAFTGRQDNFRPDSVAIDLLNIQFRPTPSVEIVAGKFMNPFDTTEAVWDHDLRPEGVAASYTIGQPMGLRTKVAAGAFFGTQLYGDESRIKTGQLTFAGADTRLVGFSLSVAYSRFDNLDVLAHRNWRQNQTVVVDGRRRFASEFEIGDALVRLRSDHWIPLEVYYDHIRNFGALNNQQYDGMEAGLKVGQVSGPWSYRFSYVYQDLDRDAVMTAFNGDDWYIHSWYRGSLYRAAVGLGRGFALQVTYIDLQHHETDDNTSRWMVDLVRR